MSVSVAPLSRLADPAAQATMTHADSDPGSATGSDPGEASIEFQGSRISNGLTVSAGLSVCDVSGKILPQKARRPVRDCRSILQLPSGSGASHTMLGPAPGPPAARVTLGLEPRTVGPSQMRLS